MLDFRILETEYYAGRLKGVFSSQLPQILTKLHTYVYPQLKNQPYFGLNLKKLNDMKLETWRYRIGDYRFFYAIDEKKKIISMLDVVHRSKAYD